MIIGDLLNLHVRIAVSCVPYLIKMPRTTPEPKHERRPPMRGSKLGGSRSGEELGFGPYKKEKQMA